MTSIKRYINSFVVIGLLFLAISCKDREKDNPQPSPSKPAAEAQSTLLIYAVATNSLSANLVSDKNEMLEAAQYIDLSKNNILICQTVYEYDSETLTYTGKGKTSMVKLEKFTDGYGWNTIKEYSNDVAPLNPSRIQEVIEYVTDTYPAKSQGLVFWSHSTASQPFGLDKTEVQVKSVSSGNADSLPMQYSFGQDKTTVTSENEQINVDVLASVLPDHVFNFIWFDSCYMSNIETIYQFRNKCNYFVGYPTEVLDNGLPYHLVLPYMTGADPELEKAADLFYQYYSDSFGTIALVDMNQIELLADYCSMVYSSGITVNGYNLMKYSRGSTGPFYDFATYSTEMAKADGKLISKEEFDEVLADVVKYSATTSGRLLGLSIDKDSFSGISTHLYSFEEDTVTERYYKSLDWYKRVFE